MVLKVGQPEACAASDLRAEGTLDCREPERTGDPAEGDGIKMAQITARKEERRNRKESWNKQKTNNKMVDIHLQTQILF